MNRPYPTTFLALTLTAGLVACSSTKQSAGIREVDSLVSRVETVHLECELSKQSVYAALTKLRNVVTPEFEGEAADVYAEFVEAVEESEDRAQDLDGAIRPMQRAAAQVFRKWESDLDAFASPGMRARSQKRLEETRGRYEAIRAAAEDSSEAFMFLNAGMRDLALFLERDFNASAVAEIEEEALTLRDAAMKLGKSLDETLLAAEAYVAAAAPRGQVQVETNTESTLEESEPGR